MQGSCGSELQNRYCRGLRVMNFQRLRRGFEPALRRLFHLYWRFARGMTLGVRGVVLDGDNKVFLVRHSYVAGWHLPGWLRWSGVVVGAIDLVIAIYAGHEVHQRNSAAQDFSPAVSAHVGAGIYLCGAAALVIGIGSITAARSRS